MDLLKIPDYAGLVRPVGTFVADKLYSIYCLYLQCPVLSDGNPMLCAISGYPDSRDIKDGMNPSECRYESMEGGVYSLRMFFYYKTPRLYHEFPIGLTFREFGPQGAELQKVNTSFIVAHPLL